MELKVSKARMELSIKILERKAAQLDDNLAMFRGIQAKDFDKEHLVMICNLFANELKKIQEKYFEALDKSFPSYIAGGAVVSEILYKPTLWRKIWNRIKEWA